MIKRFRSIFLTAYLIGVLALLAVTFTSARSETLSLLADQYTENFRTTELIFTSYFQEIQNDLLSLADNDIIRTRNDRNFTSFLNADENTFEYHYTVEELAIIRILKSYLDTHPNANSAYMGRENGSFVRAVPRSSPTQYDPRTRPWYIAAMDNPGTIQMTVAYPSVTTDDMNIGFVITLDDENDIPYGVIGIDVTLETLSKELKNQQLLFNGYIEVVDNQDMIVITPVDEHLYTQSIQDDTYKQLAKTDTVTIDRNKQFYRITYNKELWDTTFITYAPTKLVEQDLVSNLISSLLWSFLILLSIEISNLILIKRYVSKPVNELLASLRESQKTEIPKKISLTSKGEYKVFEKQYNELVDSLQQNENDLRRIRNIIVSSLSSLTSMRDFETGLHLYRASKYVHLLAEGYNELHPEIEIPSRIIEIMTESAPLHDIGKIAISDDILKKKGPLTAEEFEIMKKHTLYGKEMFEKIMAGIENTSFVDTAYNMIYYHHERWDGKGYPEKLRDSNIPLEARIMTIADSYDAMTSNRVYSKARTHEEAKAELIRCSGTQFDPHLIDVFISIEASIKSVAEAYKE
jgi:response regulator RpfG family c-di-GMP phosphodiesterase